MSIWIPELRIFGKRSNLSNSFWFQHSSPTLKSKKGRHMFGRYSDIIYIPFKCTVQWSLDARSHDYRRLKFWLLHTYRTGGGKVREERWRGKKGNFEKEGNEQHGRDFNPLAASWWLHLTRLHSKDSDLSPEEGKEYERPQDTENLLFFTEPVHKWHFLSVYDEGCSCASEMIILL